MNHANQASPHGNDATQLRRPLLALLSLVIAAALPMGTTQAQTYPDKPIRIIVPTTPGGTLDFVTRLVATNLSKTWTQGLLVDNRAGAGGVIGADLVAKAPPDGYTLGFIASQFTVSAAIDAQRIPYDAVRDFAPVAILGFGAWGLAVNPALPVNSVKDLITLAKAKPGQINYASTGAGGSTHLAAEMLKSMTGTDMVHVPYKGTVPAVTDVVAGHVNFTIGGLTTLQPLAKSGKLRIIATVGTYRSKVLPDVPTIGETVPGYEYNNWYGVVAPRGTPPAIVARLHENILRVLKIDDVQQKLLAQGFETNNMSSADFARQIQKEVSGFTELVKKVGITVK